MRRKPMDIAATVAVVVLAAVALYFGGRYGDRYRIGDTEHRRNTFKDFALVAGPIVGAASFLLVVVVRRANPDGFWAEWRRERSELRSAKQGTSSRRR